VAKTTGSEGPLDDAMVVERKGLPGQSEIKLAKNPVTVTLHNLDKITTFKR
jgi:hypothetical protein